MFSSMQSTHQLQVWHWLIFSGTICTLAHTLRKALEAYWNHPELRKIGIFGKINSTKKREKYASIPENSETLR